MNVSTSNLNAHTADEPQPSTVAGRRTTLFDPGEDRRSIEPGQRFTIVCDDALAFAKNLADEQMRLVVTSPPYNLGKSYESKTSLDAYLADQQRVIAECARVLHPQGSICWQVGNYVDRGEIVPLDSILYPVFKDLGLKLRNRIVWHFGHGLHSSRRLSGRYETINWWTKSDDYVWNLDPIRVPAKYPNKRHFKGPNVGKLSGNPKGKNPSDVWEFPNVKNNHPEKTVHPCQFPVELVERLVLSMTNPGDSVFDPYMGVGSSVIAALMHDRVGYGCDNVAEYVNVARERIRMWQHGTLRTRPMGKPIYDPSKPNGGQSGASTCKPSPSTAPSASSKSLSSATTAGIPTFRL